MEHQAANHHQGWTHRCHVRLCEGFLHREPDQYDHLPVCGDCHRRHCVPFQLAEAKRAFAQHMTVLVAIHQLRVVIESEADALERVIDVLDEPDENHPGGQIANEAYWVGSNLPDTPASGY